MTCLLEFKNPIDYGASRLKVKVTGVKTVKLVSVNYLTNHLSQRFYTCIYMYLGMIGLLE